MTTQGLHSNGPQTFGAGTFLLRFHHANLAKRKLADFYRILQMAEGGGGQHHQVLLPPGLVQTPPHTPPSNGAHTQRHTKTHKQEVFSGAVIANAWSNFLNLKCFCWHVCAKVPRLGVRPFSPKHGGPETTPPPRPNTSIVGPQAVPARAVISQTHWLVSQDRLSPRVGTSVLCTEVTSGERWF